MVQSADGNGELVANLPSHRRWFGKFQVVGVGGDSPADETRLSGHKPQVVAIPLAHDQPAVASRLARLKLAEVLPVMRLSAKRIRNAVAQVLGNPRYREAAIEMQKKLRSLRGLERAVEVIEESLEKQFVHPRIGTKATWRSTGDRLERNNTAAVSLAPR